MNCVFFFFQAEDGIRDLTVTGVQTCALPILRGPPRGSSVTKQKRLLYIQPLTGATRVADVRGFFCETRSADRKSTRLNSSHSQISYAVFCLKKKNTLMSPSCVTTSFPKTCTI